MNKYQSYVICATTRSGSTLLCKLLQSSGVAGKPESYFHQPSIASWQKALNLSPPENATQQDVLREILTAVLHNGSAGTNVFGLRLMRKSFDFLSAQLDVLFPGSTHDAERFEAAFGRTLYIHLSRSDKVGQAISLIKADQSGLWHMAPDGTELERNAPPKRLTYNADVIARHLAEITEYDAAWERWFAQENLQPMRVTYEALSADPTGTLVRMLERLGLDPKAANGVVPSVAKLADATSRIWAEQFRAEHADGSSGGVNH